MIEDIFAMFDNPVDHAWRAYRTILKNEGAEPEQLAIAQEAFKAGWSEGTQSINCEELYG